MDGFTQLDGSILIGIQHALNADWLTPIMKAVTVLGEKGIFAIALCLILMIFKKTRRLGIICACSLALTFILCNLTLKPLVNRTRPWIMFSGVTRFLPPPGDASFPSGHSANSMGAVWAMFMASLPVKTETTGKRSCSSIPCLGWRGEGADPKLIHKLSAALVVLVLLIGLSRLYLGMHYPSDVVAGLLLGQVCAAVVFSAIRKIEVKRGRLIGEDRTKGTGN